ncbi:MAG: YigZ family protein [Ruminococcaceae bacterium]|nr:YigZ family protein [Oscillospiraceae bacterium]
MTEYITVKQAAEAEFEEKRSRFIGYVSPAKTAEEALAFVAKIKAMHKQATHNVWAYNLKDGSRRYSDDGEPQGTAGIPVLEVLTKSGVQDAAVVVTRYFGGILLGAGGLVRAYGQGAKLALDAGGIVVMTACADFSLIADYAAYGKISYALDGFSAKEIRADFGEAVEMTVRVREKDEAAFLDGIRELTAGRVVPTLVSREFCPF